MHARHFVRGGGDPTITVCGIRGVDARALDWTRDPSRVSCRRCRRWLQRSREAWEAWKYDS